MLLVLERVRAIALERVGHRHRALGRGLRGLISGAVDHSLKDHAGFGRSSRHVELRRRGLRSPGTTLRGQRVRRGEHQWWKGQQSYGSSCTVSEWYR